MVMKLAEQKPSKARRKRSRPDLEMIAEGVRLILEGIGEDLHRILAVSDREVVCSCVFRCHFR